MKNKLKEYLPLTDKKRKAIWKKGVFVIDANVLLNMCRYSKQSSDELIAIIKTHKDKIWLPYQVALEFFNNRLGVIAGINSGFDKLIEKVGKIDGVIEERLDLKNYKSDTAHNTAEIRKEIDNFKKRLVDKLNKWKEEFAANDKEFILNEILDLYDGKVGDDYDEPTMEAIYKEGAQRYKELIPPGFADLDNKKNKGSRHLYGDLIWWKQAMDYAKAKKCDLVIVTDDKKEDWWYKVSGETIGPRVELIREFSEKTGGRHFLMYQTHQFMEMAKELDGAAVSDSSIQEAKDTGSVDYQHVLDMFKYDGAQGRRHLYDPYAISGNRMGFSDGAFNSAATRRLATQGSLNYDYLQGLYNPDPIAQIVDPSLGTSLFDFFGQHPDGKMTLPVINKDDNKGFEDPQ